MGALSGSDGTLIELSGGIVDVQPAAYPVLDCGSADHLDICTRIKYPSLAFSGATTWSKFAKSPFASPVSDRDGYDRNSEHGVRTYLGRPYRPGEKEGSIGNLRDRNIYDTDHGCCCFLYIYAAT